MRMPQNSPTPCKVALEGAAILPSSFPWFPLAETSKKPVTKKFPLAVWMILRAWSDPEKPCVFSQEISP